MRTFFCIATMTLATAGAAAALSSAGCAAGEDVPLAAAVEQSQPLAVGADHASQQNLLAGPWAFAGSDVQPDTSYAIHGNAIDLSFNGYFRWNGTWKDGYRGYTFKQPVAVVQGERYRLSIVVSNANTPIPSVLWASLSGAGAEQRQSVSGNGTIDFDFTVASDPGAAVVALTAHPVLGHLGPTEGIGIGVQTYSVSASLIRLPSSRVAWASDLGNGSVKFAALLPSGQAYVELFVRQNGIQNVARNIVGSAVDHGDGTATYSYVGGGYRAGDAIEYRFYDYLPSSPGLFTPGPVENLWLSSSYGTQAFVTDDATYTVGPHDDAAGNPVDVEVYTAAKLSRIQPVSVGWQLVRANASPFSTGLVRSHARMLGVYVKTCDTGQWVNIANTPFAGASPAEQEDAAAMRYTYSFFFNGELPGQRVAPKYECGGNDITISTLIGPQTLRTNAAAQFAYVVEHR